MTITAAAKANFVPLEYVSSFESLITKTNSKVIEVQLITNPHNDKRH